MPKFQTLLVATFVLGLLFLVVGLAVILPMPHSPFEWFAAVTLASYFVGVGGADIWQIRRIARYLREKHPEAWKRLGIISVRLAGFARRPENIFGLHDPELDQMYYFKKRFDTVTAILFIVILGALLLLHRGSR